MYRLQIAEDEPLAREAILRSVDFAAHGFELVAVSEDGRMALADYERHRPHLLITDINMPYLSGLEVARRIQASEQPAAVVILTGYDEFEYARTALLTGVTNYVLKPVTAQEFGEILDRERERLDTLRENQRQVQAVEGRLYAMNPVVRDRELGRLVNGTLEVDLSELPGGERLARFRYGEVALIRVADLEKTARRLDMARDLLVFAVTNVVSELAEADPGCYVFSLANGNVGLLYVSDDETVLPGALKRLLERARVTLAEIAGLLVETGLGERIEKREELPLSFRQAQADLDRPQGEEQAQALVRQATAYIEEHYADGGLSLLEVTSHLAVSVSHFTALFKEQIGKTFVEYLTDRRIEAAKTLLVRDDRMLYRIASDVGYENPTYFASIFKKTVGVSPRDYRKLYRRRQQP